jgi:ribonuclease HI
MSNADEADIDHEGEPKPGFHILFTDGNKNPGGTPKIGGLLKYRTKGRRWEQLPGGEFTKRARGRSIDEWEYEALIEGIKLAMDKGAKYVWAYMDRRSVVEQVIHPSESHASRLVPYRDEVLKLKAGFTVFELSWIPREMNREADDLARSSRESGTSQ